MRVACFSPLPPARSGIADYSVALVENLRPLVDLDVYSVAGQAFDASQYDLAVYQIGNNADHVHAYETALQHPGVVVLHEANLHHLICDVTIRRGDWDAYVAECEYNGGAEARAFSERVRGLEVGPDYDGVPMLRRLLERARGLIVHSRYVLGKCREAGYAGPAAVIPHGAWLPLPDRMGWRSGLGIDETAPLIGIFGFLKPYKRISQSLRAFARLVKSAPSAKLLMVGEEHSDFPLDPQIRALGLEAHVRKFGYARAEAFEGYIGACDIVLNLRYPTVGETSGTHLRALGMGKAVVVSDVGSFREFPDQICLKVPVDAREEDTLFEYLNLLVSRPTVARNMGGAARTWVERECAWPLVARRYADFLEAVHTGRPVSDEPRSEAPAAMAPPAVQVPGEYLLNWAEDPGARDYISTHLTRLTKTLELTPAGSADQRALEMGAYLQITPSLRTKLGYGDVRGCYYGPAGKTEHRQVKAESGETFTCEVDLFDAEKDAYPYPDGHFHTVLCCELLEHLTVDPMFMMSEINRITADAGHLVLTTPNIASMRGINAILTGYHPGLFPAYIKPPEPGKEPDARHNREYTAREVYLLLNDAGFTVTRLETGPFREEPHPEYLWIEHLLKRYGMPSDLRGEGIYIVGRKTGPVRSRWPEWLYS